MGQVNLVLKRIFTAFNIFFAVSWSVVVVLFFFPLLSSQKGAVGNFKVRSGAPGWVAPSRFNRLFTLKLLCHRRNCRD